MRLNLKCTAWSPGGAALLATLLAALLGTLGAAPAIARAASDDPAQAIAGGPERVERQLACMGTGLRVEVVADTREEALQASEVAVRALEAAEQRLSTWRADTELARLNATPVGEPAALSPRLALELEAALELARATGGAFDPTLGALVAAWDLRGGGRRPAPDELEAARAACGHDGLRLAQRDGAPVALRLRAGLSLEEGGFGKGAGLDAARAALAALPDPPRSALIDLGGQVALFGACGPVEIAVADPRDRARACATLTIESGSLATSGNSERAIEVDGQRLGHLLDPRTGRPAPERGSVTVWAPTALAADALATGLYVLGPDAALAWAAERPDVEVLVCEPTGDSAKPLRLRATAGLRERLTRIPHPSEEASDAPVPGSGPP